MTSPIDTGATAITPPADKPGRCLVLARICFWITVAAGAFHAAYTSASTSFLIVVYLFALLQLARAPTWRKAFYPGLAVGMMIAGGRLGFFWSIFSGGAVGLWLVYAFWIGLFVALARLILCRLGPKWGSLLIPFLWAGLEYFRSELYYLRFSWLSPGYAFAHAPWATPLHWTGMYGVGFLLAGVAAAAAAFWWQRSVVRSLATLAIGAALVSLGGLASGRPAPPHPAATVHIAGVQMEFPTESEVLSRLNELLRKHPETEVAVLSEYTFDGPVPERVMNWCRQNRRYLVAGGKDPVPGGNFYNTTYVVGPDGSIVFRQVKAVPIQFFKDGLPAPVQRLWESPWGKIGICICYDLSYTRVTDRLVELGAQALIIPTMDVMDWGVGQHVLHARVTPVRAAEYGIPIFRLASSGISQYADGAGHVVATAPCPGDGAMLAGTVGLANAGRLPLDRWLGPFAAGVTGAGILLLLVTQIAAKWLRRRTPAPQPS